MCWSLSLVIVKKMRHGLSKKKIHEGPWVHEKKEREKKEKETPEGLEKKDREEEIAMLSKGFKERETTEKEFPFHPPQSIHVHILI